MTDRQKVGQTGIMTNMTESWTDRHNDRQTESWTDRNTDRERQTRQNRQVETET